MGSHIMHIVNILCTGMDLMKTKCKKGYLDSFQRPICPDLVFKPNNHGFSMTLWFQLEGTEMNERFIAYSILRMTFSPNIGSGNMHISLVFNDLISYIADVISAF